jgi:hypothetical protein
MFDYLTDNCTTGLHDDWSLAGGVAHYFGCLRFSERAGFLEALPGDDDLKKMILDEEARVSRLRETFEQEGERTDNGRLLRSLKAALSQRFPSSTHSALPNVATAASQLQSAQPDINRPLSTFKYLEDLGSNVVYFKKGRPYDHPKLENKFPDQKIPLSVLLKNNPGKNPLMWDCEENMIRYFHLPANNMDWVEVGMT